MTSDREIKFRGKRLGNGEWVYGDLLHGRGSLTWIVVDAHKTLYESGSPDSILAPNNEQNVFRVDPKSVGQFIGKKDTNGQEVYEDDVIKCTFDIHRLVKATPPPNVSYAHYVRRGGDPSKIETTTEPGTAVVEMIDGCWVANYASIINKKIYNLLIPSGYEVIGNISDNLELLEGQHE